MPKLSTAESRRARVIKICAALPEATSSGDRHIKFEVRGKSFAYYLHDHHGDGRLALCTKAAPGEQDTLLHMDPQRFFVPAYLGAKGWVGCRLDLKDIDWGQVEALLHDSYRLLAPKRLAALV